MFANQALGGWLRIAALALAGSVSGLQAVPVEATPAAAVVAGTPPASNDIAQWIARLHNASSSRSYVGTFVVLSSSGAMASSHISHVCSGTQQLERIETLTGTPRITYRLGNEVRTFWPQSRTVRREQREPAAAFPQLPWVQGAAVAEFYSAHYVGVERVAGLLADMVWFKPQDTLRFGYRIWSERDSGLVLKMQTLQADGRVLEQVAFSTLDMNASVRKKPLLRKMEATAGYRVLDMPKLKTSALEHGWRLRQPVDGFVPISCYIHSAKAASAMANTSEGTLQCIYSDGLATVSLFIDAYDGKQAPARAEGQWSMGATHTLARRLEPDGWLTAVGEVPLGTLVLFARRLERVR